MAVIILLTFAVLLKASDHPKVQAFIEQRTGKPVVHWGEVAGRACRHLFVTDKPEKDQ